MFQCDALNDTASTTVKFTDVAPRSNVDGLVGPLVTGPTQLSVPTGRTNDTLAVHTPASVVLEIKLGHVICGASTSTTVTVNEHGRVSATGW